MYDTLNYFIFLYHPSPPISLTLSGHPHPCKFLVRIFLRSAADPDDKERVVLYLLKKNAKVNLQDLHGRTALMFACLSSSGPSIIQALLDAKANPWLEDREGFTSFDHAINGGDLETTRLLINSCREHKLLLKADNPVELKQLQDCLWKIQEMRKVSWPLLGPSVRPESAYTPRVPELLDCAESKPDTLSLSPRPQRQRKRSVCHFDPLDIDEILKSDEDTAKERQPVSPAKIGDAVETQVDRTENGRSRPPSLSKMTEEERISLHFSSTESSVEDPGLGLAALLMMNGSSTEEDHLHSTIPEITTNEQQNNGNKTCSNPKHFEQMQPCGDSSSFPTISGTIQPNSITSGKEQATTQGDTHGKAGSAAERSIDDHCTLGMNSDESGPTLLNPCHILKPQGNEKLDRGSTESLAGPTTGKFEASPKQRRKTVPGTQDHTANGERKEEGRRRHTLAADANKLCRPFVSQRLSPTPREIVLIEVENRKSPTLRDTTLAGEVPFGSSEFSGRRSPLNEGNANVEGRRTSEYLPAIQNDKSVQLPAISARRKSPVLYINVRGPGTIGHGDNVAMPSRSDELRPIDERRSTSPTARGRISPLSPRRMSPLPAKHEASSGFALDMRAKQAHKTQSVGGSAGQDGSQARAQALPGQTRLDGTAYLFEELDHQKPVSQLSPRGDSANRQPILLPPLRLNAVATGGSLDSEEGYYSCSPSPFDVESPKRTPGFTEQPKYLFKPISPRTAQRFRLNWILKP